MINKPDLENIHITYIFPKVIIKNINNYNKKSEHIFDV